MVENLDQAFIQSESRMYSKNLSSGVSTLLTSKSRTRIAIHFLYSGSSYFVAQEAIVGGVGTPAVSATMQQSFTQWEHGDQATNEWHGLNAEGGIACWIEVHSKCLCSTGHGPKTEGR